MSDKVQYTPGPWAISPETNGQEIVAYDTNPWRVRAEIVGVYKWPENWLANARLIAAAPDMAEACADVWMELADSSDPTLRRIADDCRAAYAKATGL